jgi:DNA (cytosine-5)-methyltransferase 1
MGGLTSVEICAGGGGQALGLEQAGFDHEAVVELDADACETLRLNRGAVWKVTEGDVHGLDGRGFRGVDLLAGGVPCPPFSIAGRQLGADDDRDLFPQALRLVREIGPRAVLLENVRGLAAARFGGYRAQVLAHLHALGYQTWWDLVHASEHGVPQLRPRFVLVALREPWAARFRWPQPAPGPPPTVADALGDLMRSRGWPGADAWCARARAIAPTIVGGSRKHGGPDLGPTRARAAWKALGVDGLGVADEAPGPDFPAGRMPKLTVRMVARLQGFPDTWQFCGRKTAAYRQVGNAFPPPVARALGQAIRDALSETTLPPRSRPAEPGHHASLTASRVPAAIRPAGAASPPELITALNWPPGATQGAGRWMEETLPACAQGRVKPTGCWSPGGEPGVPYDAILIGVPAA